MTRFLVAMGLVALLAMPAMAGGFTALAGPGTDGDGQASIIYDASNGAVGVDAPATVNLTSLNLDSAGSKFVTANVDMSVFNNSFDNVKPNNLFKATFGSSFGDTMFGNGVLPAGLTADQVIADLSAVGSLLGGGALGAVDLICLNCGGGPVVGLPEGTLGDEQTSLVYYEATGALGVDAPASKNLTSINIDSKGSKFNTANVDMSVFNNSFDNVKPNNLFKATFGSSFGSVSFGNGVMAAGLARDVVATDLSAVGSLLGGGDLGAMDLVFVPIPEPSTLILLGLGLLLGLVGLRRR